MAYQEFLTLWKDADADIPILKAARAEYEALKWFDPGYLIGRNEECQKKSSRQLRVRSLE